MVTEGACGMVADKADDAAWQGQWEARRALAEKGAQWRSVADGVAWQGLGWQLAGRRFVRPSKSRIQRSCCKMIWDL